MVRRILVALALAWAAWPTVSPAHARAVTPAARLHAAAARYRRHLLSERPDLASRAGLERADSRLEPVTEATLGRDAATLSALGESLATLDTATLARRDRATLDTLRARVGRELAPLRDGTWRSDPAIYLGLAHDAPLESARRARRSPCERARRTAGRLRGVPETLRAAEVALRGARIADPEAEAARWRVAMLDLRVTLPALFSDCHEGERYAAFVEADTLALEAMGRFTRFLLDRDSLASISGANR